MTGMIGFLSLVLDIGLFLVGVWALVKGSLPARLLKTLLGEGDYRTDSRNARFFGSVLLVPFGIFILAVVVTVTASQPAAIIFSTLHFNSVHNRGLNRLDVVETDQECRQSGKLSRRVAA
jgi:hypothetical protein